MKKFYLQRNEDETGVSGVGRVADGVIFENGKAVLCWRSNLSSVAVYETIEQLEKIHGHGGKTQVVFEDAEPKLREWYVDLGAVDMGNGVLCHRALTKPSAGANVHVVELPRGHTVLSEKRVREEWEEIVSPTMDKNNGYVSEVRLMAFLRALGFGDVS